jgi:hypothetical protein
MISRHCHLIPASAAILIIIACGTQPAAQDLSADEIVRWASSHASPISEETLWAVAGSADVVAVGESAHGGEEALAFRTERVNDFETATAVLLVERLRGDERLGFPNRVDPQVIRRDDRRSWGILGSRFLEGRVDPYSLG